MACEILIDGVGAVTPVGLTAPQTVSAIRAGLTGFAEIAPLPSPHAAVVGARIPAAAALRATRMEWLVNLANRALTEALAGGQVNERTALLLIAPEPARDEPVLRHSTADRVFAGLLAALGHRWHPASQVLTQGRAAAFDALQGASMLLNRNEVDVCLVGGVDSCIGRADVDRLRQAGRLAGAHNPQGVLPGEGSAFVRLRRGGGPNPSALARVLGLGIAHEDRTVHGSGFSSGKGLRQAVEQALAAARIDESQIGLRVSDMTGERYAAIEGMIAGARCYRTRRERLATVWPAAAAGDLGAAAGVLVLVCGALLGRHPRAPGGIVACESASDEGLRGACLLEPVPGGEAP